MPQGVEKAPSRAALLLLRRVSRLFGAAVSAVLLPVLAIQIPYDVIAHVGVAGAAVALPWFAWGYRRGPARRSDHWGLLAIALFGIGLEEPSQGLGIVLAAILFRAVHCPGRGYGPLIALMYALGSLASGWPLSPEAVVETLFLATLACVAAPMAHKGLEFIEQSERSRDEHEVMLATGTQLLASSTAAEVASVTCSAFLSVLGKHVDRPVALVTLDDTNGGLPAQIVDSLALLHPGALADGFRALLAEGRPFLTTDLEVTGDRLQRALTSADATWLIVPLRGARATVGFLHARVRRSPNGDHAWLQFAESFANPVALALERVRLTDHLVKNETRFRSLVQNSSDVIAVLDRDGNVCYVSPSIARALGYPPAALHGATLDGLIHPDDAAVWQRLRTPGDDPHTPPQRATIRLRHRTQRWRHCEATTTDLLREAAVEGIVLNIRDITERKELEEELHYRAYHDPLTGLSNRTLFLDRLRQALRDSSSRHALGVIFIDLDDFKTVNDTLGHAAGDAVLLEVATRLRATAAREHVVGRLSGDEFAVLARELESQDQAVRLAENIHRVLSEPYTIHGSGLRMSATLGVALGGRGVEEAEDVLHRADLAMYAAKSSGKNRFQVFRADSTLQLTERRQLQSDLQWAVLRDELEVRYQPIIRLSDHEIVAAEALVRWRHPSRGLLGPETFIQLAEQSGLIDDVFEKVLDDALAECCSWNEGASDSAISVNVNLSPVQLHHVALVEQITTALQRHHMPADRLTLEITETAVIEDPVSAAQTLATLRQLGVKVAIDDFGTGQSSLATLRRLPVDVLKIDKLFLQGLDTRGSSAFPRTIVQLGAELGLVTVAEGIERAEQSHMLQQIGCTHGQGHHVSRPLTAEKLRALLTRHRASVA